MRILRLAILALGVAVLGGLSVFGVVASTTGRNADAPTVPAPLLKDAVRRYGDLPAGPFCTPADVFFSADGTQVAGCFYNRVGWVTCWDVRSGEQTTLLQEGERQTFTGAFLPNGRRLLTASLDDTLLVWDLESREPLALRGPDVPTRPGALLWVCNVKLSPDARTVACPALSPTADPHTNGITLFEVASGRKRGALTGTDSKWATAFAFSPDGRQLLGAVAGGCVLWDLATGKIVRRLEHTDGASAGCFSPDGRSVALTGVFPYPATAGDREWQRLKFIDLDSGRVRHCTYTDYRNDGEKAVVWSANGWLVATISMRQPRIRLWDPATGEPLASIDYSSTGTFTGGIAFSPDSKSLATTTSFGCVLLWDLTSQPCWKDVKRPKKVAPPPTKDKPLTKAERNRLWDDLTDTDGAVAYHATWELARHRADAVQMLHDHLRPVEGPQPEQIARLLSDLDDASYAARQRASGELRALARHIAPDLRAAKKSTSSPEVRHRLGVILDELNPQFVTDAETLRALHAIEVLEHIGGSEAVEMLRAMSKGASGAEQTQGAKASLRRLTTD